MEDLELYINQILVGGKKNPKSMSHIFGRLFWVFPDVDIVSEKANEFVSCPTNGFDQCWNVSDFTGGSAAPCTPTVTCTLSL